MQYKAANADEYIAQLPEDRQAAIKKLRAVIKKNLPKGFKEGTNYGMMGWSVPHSLYPKGYHCKPEDPLPFMSIASQKTNKKLDMGKSCMRYKKAEDIPYELIGELASKITPEQWIKCYEGMLKK